MDEGGAEEAAAPLDPPSSPPNRMGMEDGSQEGADEDMGDAMDVADRCGGRAVGPWALACCLLTVGLVRLQLVASVSPY
jgi:hypothetical protein